MINRVLIIDDDVEFSSQLASCLVNNNYFVAVANNLQVALSHLIERFDLVFCDAAMTDLEIKDFVIQLKEIQPEIHVVITTNNINANHINKLIDSGVSDFISKPFFNKEINGFFMHTLFFS